MKKEHKEASRLKFEAFVKSELGDIAVSDDSGRYISHKIQNYWRTWQESESYHVPRADAELAAYALTVENLTTERDAMAEQVKALEADAGRYRWLIEYLVSDDTQHDDAILIPRTAEELDGAIAAAIKGSEK